MEDETEPADRVDTCPELCGNVIQFPNEIFMNILRFLPTKDLLKYRFVNSAWKAIATTFCHQHCVHLNHKLPVEASKCLETFRHVDNLPWSACKIKLRDTGESTITVLEDFLQVFGSRLRELALDAEDHRSMIEILKQTPNIQNLIAPLGNCILPPKFTWSRQDESEGWNSFKLTQLKYFHTRNSAGPLSLDFLEFIIARSPQLESVKMDFSWKISLELMKRFVPPLSNIANLDLVLYCCGTSFKRVSQILSESKLNIGTIQLQFSKPWSSDPSYYRSLQNLLTTTAPALKELTLIHSSDPEGDGYEFDEFEEPVTWPKFQVPALPALQVLILQKFSLETEVSFGFTSPFTTNQFPVLEQVEITYNGVWHYRHDTLFSAFHFDSVKKFKFKPCHYHMDNDWARVFPNLTELSTKGHVSTLQYILKNMKGLKKLKLYLSNEQSNEIEQMEECRKLWEILDGPAFRRFTQQLTHLNICICATFRGYAPNGGVSFLLKLPPLDSLTLQEFGIPKGVEEELSRKHKQLYVIQH